MSLCLHSLLQAMLSFGLWSRDQETEEVFRAAWLKKDLIFGMFYVFLLSFTAVAGLSSS